MLSVRPRRGWSQVQARYADVPGEEGVALRKRHYAPFFLRFGRDVRISEGCAFFRPERIVLEDDVRINLGGLFYGSGGLVIGRHARIGPRCFVHSANHDVEPEDPRAFFERGYDYCQTIIGDNALISANVSILPGAILGTGCFVACGAVVTGTEYPGNSRLFGVPARSRSIAPTASQAIEVPELAFLVPAGRPDLADAADLLREVLGLPQVARLTVDDAVPPSVAAILCFGGAEPAAGTQAEIWRLKPGQTELDATQALLLPGEKNISLPVNRTLVTRSVPAPTAPVSARLLDVGYWIHARLFKRNDSLRDGEFREWLVALSLLEWPKETERLVLRKLWSRRPHGLHLFAPGTSDSSVEVIQRWMRRTQWFYSPPAKAHKGRRPLVWLKQRLHLLATWVKARRNRRFTKQKALRRPVDLVWQAASATQPQERERLKDLTAEILPQCETSLQWVSVGIAAHLLELPGVLEQAREALVSAERQPSRGGLPQQLPGKPQLLLSPLYAVWMLLIETGRAQVPDDFMTPASFRQDLKWRGFTGGKRWTMGAGRLIDEDERWVSEDLLLNWLTLQTAPCDAGNCLELIPEAYSPSVARLEDVWLALLTHLLHRNGRPLIRLCPWPAPYRAALSLRYDIDRPISPTRLRHLVRLQARHANAPLGSWYFRAEDPSMESLPFYMALGLQEVGVHVESLDEVAAGDGVTHHSAPTSAYWQGDHTTHCLAERGAAYGEFHGAGLSTPRRAWLAPVKPEDGLGSHAEVMLTALHFPLEGGTDDHDLTYFDRLLPAFRERLGAGGHAIIGSHPDLDQDPLKRLFEREATILQDVWMAPVFEVMKRWRDVMTPGRIKTARGPKGEAGIVSDDPLGDVRVLVHAPSGQIHQEILQLSPGMLRPLSPPQDQEKAAV